MNAHAASELVLCFPRAILDHSPHQTPFFNDHDLWRHILTSLEPVPRHLAEKDYNLKQLVVYILITSGPLILTYRRTQKTLEDRLREKYSIGVGGHVNIEDHQLPIWSAASSTHEQVIVQAVHREINEEVHIESRFRSEPKLMGFINDDSDDVGKVHFGSVWHLELADPKVSSKREHGIADLTFYDHATIARLRDSLESWSRIVFQSLKEKQ